jgi:ferrochelatase
VARELGLVFARASTVGTHPAYVAMVRELIVERLTPDAPRRALGSLGPSSDRCAADCCLSGRPGPPKPALCGVDDPFRKRRASR